MRKKTLFALTTVLMVVAAASVGAAEISLKLSGPGAAGENTIKAGQTVSIDIMIENDTIATGFTLGFKITSPDLESIVHVADKDNGINEAGDVKGFNGWQDESIWDLNGVFVRETDWDGKLPDTLGFGGLAVKSKYTAHKMEKKLSFDIMVPQTGTLVIDSSFFPPGGKWLFSAPERISTSTSPDWGGPYKFQVVK
jgi:hypothetical protein